MNRIRWMLTLVVLTPLLTFAQEVAPIAPVVPPANGFAQAFWGYVFPVLMGLLSTLVLGLGGLASAWFKQRIDAMAADSVAKKFAVAGDKLFSLAMNAVAHINTTLKPKFVEYMRDGTLSPEEAALLKADAKKLLLEAIGPEMEKYLRDTLGTAFDGILSGVIERAVVAVKATAPTRNITAESAVVPPQP